MFIWDFVADKILGQIVDWFYGQVVGFLGNFFAEMGNMGVELFEMSWVQSIVLFFSYLAWALYGTGLVVSCFECGIEYSSGRGNIRETALNAIKGFMAVSLFTVVPVRLYELSVTLQGQLTAGITGYGASIGDVASDIMQEFSAVESLTDLASGPFLGFGSITSGIMILFCIILMAYAIIKVFFANLKRGGILLIQIAVGSLYMFSVPRGYRCSKCHEEKTDILPATGGTEPSPTAAQAAPALLLRRGSGLTPYQNKFHRTWEAAA